MKLAIAIVLSLALMGCQAIVETPTGDVVATGDCATDTFTCADGSIVNRNPAYGCEFNPCPGEDDPDTVIVEDNPDTIIVEDNEPDVVNPIVQPIVEVINPDDSDDSDTTNNNVNVNNNVTVDGNNSTE